MVSVEEFVERICMLCADRGPRGFPRKTRDRQIVMKSIVMGLDSSRVFSEAEINAEIVDWNREVAPAIETDHVTVRRWLVDYGLLERTADGTRYRMGFPPAGVAFDLEVDDIDLRATVAAYIDHRRRNRRTRPVDSDTRER